VGWREEVIVPDEKLQPIGYVVTVELLRIYHLALEAFEVVAGDVVDVAF
jgi:hypothetical protein